MGLEIRIKNSCVNVMDDKKVIFMTTNNGTYVYLVKCDAL